MIGICIREATQTDLPFILVTFTKSYRETSAYAEYGTDKVLGQLLTNVIGTWDTIVAYDPDEPTVILAWLCYFGPKHVAWCYVRPETRRAGIARALLRYAGITTTTITTPFCPTRLHWMRGNWDLRFRPCLGLS